METSWVRNFSGLSQVRQSFPFPSNILKSECWQLRREPCNLTYYCTFYYPRVTIIQPLLQLLAVILSYCVVGKGSLLPLELWKLAGIKMTSRRGSWVSVSIKKTLSVVVPQSWNVTQTFLLGELTGNSVIYSLGYVCSLKGRKKNRLLVVDFWPWINVQRCFACRLTSDHTDVWLLWLAWHWADVLVALCLEVFLLVFLLSEHWHAACT